MNRICGFILVYVLLQLGGVNGGLSGEFGIVLVLFGSWREEI